MIEKFHQAQGRPHHARAFFHHGDPAGPGHRTGRGHRFEIHLHVHVIRGQKRRRGSARNERLEGLVRPHTSPKLINQVPEGRVHGQFIIPRPFHVAAQTKDPRAGALGRSADGGEPFGSPVHDVRDVCQRLHVVDHRGFLVEAVRGRERRLGPGFPPLAFQRFEQRGFLATDISPGSRVHGDVHRDAAAVNVGTQVSGLIRFANRSLQDLRRQPEFPSYINVGGLRANGVTRNDNAFQDLVGVPLHQLTVLERTGFALVGIAAQVFGTRMVLGNETPFHAGGEPCPAPAPQAGFFHHLDKVIRRRLPQDGFQCLVPASPFIIGQRPGVAGPFHVGQENLFKCLHDDTTPSPRSGTRKGPLFNKQSSVSRKSLRIRPTLSSVSRS